MHLNKTNLFLVISICLIFFLLTYNDVKSKEIKTISGTAIVTDGDSIKINNKKIRLVGIDAPELKQTCQHAGTEYPCGEMSKEWLNLYVENFQITCFYSEKDRYKRILGVCYIGNIDSVAFKKKIKSLELNSMMVKSGNAVAYRKYSDVYVEDEEYAQINKRGIWMGEFEMPWEWRKKN
jgi:endonuclease YncB( thermonuclease family)